MQHQRIRTDTVEEAAAGQAAERRNGAKSAGFSLIELLIVLAIVALIVGLVGPRLLDYLEKAKSQTARTQIDNFAKTLDLYAIDNSRYPTTSEGLDALIHQPAASKTWAGPYLKGDKLPLDPWGQPYHYRSPGEHGKYDIYSYGSDGREGGTGTAADVTSW